MKIFFIACILSVSILLIGCSGVPSATLRQISVDNLAQGYGWGKERITTPFFDLISYSSETKNSGRLLTIYIEGDGFAWLTRTTPSTNPTPINPIGLKLALNHPSGNAVYLARPCQYVGGNKARGCHKMYWTNKRFSEEVIAASNQAITILKAEFSATQLQLVGYSGGGAVATLVAARRNDVIRLITVVGNLDHQVWTDEKQLSPLIGSLNPADYWQKLTEIEQIHFIGGNDPIIGVTVAQSYKQHFSDDRHITIITQPNFDHHCCWVEQWRSLSAPYFSR